MKLTRSFFNQWDETELLTPLFYGLSYCVTEYKLFIINRQYFECCKILLEFVFSVTAFPRKMGTIQNT